MTSIGLAAVRSIGSALSTTQRGTARLEGAETETPAVSRAPFALVLGAVVFNLYELRAERNFTPMLNDASVHAQMVRFAAAALRRGQLPLTSWYPDLGLGSPQFLHYQSLGAMVTGAAGLVVGPNRAFSWSLYLLLSLWPISIYISSRIFGLSRAQAAVAAAASAFLFSDSNALSIGYEQGAYVWIGFGLWSQLFGMWTLPIAWSASWRYVSDGSYRVLAVIAASATIGFHFMTGYLAILPVVIWVAVSPGSALGRLRRGAVFLVATLLCSAWVLYPLIHFGKWASINEFLVGTGSADSYGAPQDLRWLVTGDLFDAGRWPIITVLFAIGLIVSIASAQWSPRHRALIGVFGLSLVLFFGRPTLGPLVDLLPGSQDLFLRRFLMGVQLSAIFLSGIGLIAARDLAMRVVRRSRIPERVNVPRVLALGLSAALLVAVLAPAWTETASYDAADAADISYQQLSGITDGSDMAAVTAKMDALGPGRVFAGMPAPDWGASFTVGEVPVFKYLSNLDFDMVGYTLRTASLMTDPEENFDENNVGDYALFGIRYLVLPPNRMPVPRAKMILAIGPYSLWEVEGNGSDYVTVASTQGAIVANRANVGSQTIEYMDSSLPGENVFETVAFAGGRAHADTLAPDASIPSSVGTVLSEQDHLDQGTLTATIVAIAPAVVVLKASFDPGWRVEVDGHSETPYMVTPAMPAVTVSPGRHTVTFTYHGYRHYPELFALGLVTLGLLIFARRIRTSPTLGKVRSMVLRRSS